MLPKEIEQQIDRESLNERKEAGGNFDYMDGFEDGYTAGATAWAEKMIGFAEWIHDEYFKVYPQDDTWFWIEVGSTGLSKYYNTAELLMYYINQIKK